MVIGRHRTVSMRPDPSLIARLDSAFPRLEPLGRLLLLRDSLPGRLVFTTSFGLEDQVLLHLITEAGVDVEIATLDTGRLFAETYALWARTEARYAVRIRPFYPDTGAIEALVLEQGIDGFYAAKPNRIACCGVRKTAPLRRALDGAASWLTGLRAGQSATRQALPFVTHDPEHGLIKANPLLDWTRAQAAAFALVHDVPTNPLHDRGFPSIGCAPCTRAIAPGEPERAGRWWWEEDGVRECGLHVQNGRLVRAGA